MASARGVLAQSLALGLVASLLLAFGLMMMKVRASALPMARGRGTLGAVMAWIRDPVWIGGLAVQAAGYALYMVALARAPVSMMAVAMQGGIALFVVLAVVFLGERARIWEWLGIGAFLVAALMLGRLARRGCVAKPARHPRARNSLSRRGRDHAGAVGRARAARKTARLPRSLRGSRWDSPVSTPSRSPTAWPALRTSPRSRRYCSRALILT